MDFILKTNYIPFEEVHTLYICIENYRYQRIYRFKCRPVCIGREPSIFKGVTLKKLEYLCICYIGFIC